MAIKWKLLLADENPYAARVDSSVSLPAPPSRMLATPPHALLCIVGGDSEHPRKISFPQSSLIRFHQPTAWLDDDCINSGSQLILQHFSTASTLGDLAIFPSFTFSMHRGGESEDDAVWRVSRCALNFWDKDIWLFPIHRAGGHWTLAIVYWLEHRIAYFDSLASASAHESDSMIIFTLLRRLQRLVGEHKHATQSIDGDWIAYPLVTEPLQQNGHDCGVWVLACTAAILRGYTSVNLPAHRIADFRLQMLGLIYSGVGAL